MRNGYDNDVDAYTFKWYHNPQNWIRIIIAIVLSASIIFALCHPTFSMDLLTFFLKFIENHPWDGAMAYILAYILCNILMVPGIILSLGAGMLYTRAIGFWPGLGFATLVVTISCFLGSCVAFLNARFLLRGTVVYFVRKYPKFKLIDRAVKKQGFKVVFLFRLTPITPYSLFNYLMGFSSVRFVDYCLGAIGVIPNVFAYVYLGASINNIYELSKVNVGNNIFLLTMTIVGGVSLVFIVAYFAWLARKELRRISKEIHLENMNELTSDIENAPLTAEMDSDLELL